MNAPAEIVSKAERRQQARLERDFAMADQLRAEIADAGWIVSDVPAGFSLALKPPFEVFPRQGRHSLLGRLLAALDAVSG